MRRDIFTSYIICNRLNLETLFEPIIYFIEIGKPKELPLWELYMKILSRTAQAKTPQYWYWLQQICNRKFFKLLIILSPHIKYSLNIRRGKPLKLFFVMIMPKYQVSSFVFMLVDSYRPLESSLSLFLFIWFYYFYLCLIRIFFFFYFFIDRNSLVETLWIDWNPRFILDHDDWIKPQAKLKDSLSKNRLIITYSINRWND